MGQERPSLKPTALNSSEDESESAVQRVMSSFVEGLSRRLAGLCDATGLSAETAKTADDVLRDLIVPWSRVEAFARAPGSGWISEISDDNTPIEFSVTISPTGSEVRVLFEPQGEEQTLAGHRDAALRMHEQLARQYAADLSRFRLVSDLFTPSGMQGPFALWSAVVFANGKPPSFKSYFNPQAQGVGSAVALVEEALRRLGLPRAWRHLASTMARRGPHRDELKYFALDLSTSEQARVKVYVRHHEATPEDLEIAASAASDSTRGEAQDFARAMGGRALRFKERATFTCAAFVGGQDDRPSATTQYVPVCAYALDDLEVERRVASYLGSQGIDDAPYRRVLAAFANRPLDAGVGLQSWVAFRRYRGVPRLTVYLGTETRCVFPPGSVPAGTRDHMLFDSPSQILSCVAQYSLSEHPLLRALSRLSQRREVLWLLVSNASALLTNTTELSLANLNRWLSDNATLGTSLPVAYEPYRNLFTEALSLFEESPEAVDAIAGRSAAANAARALAKTLAEFLESEETSSIGLSLDSILREASAADTERLSRLDAAGVAALPAMVRGALAVHEKLWSALDRLSNLASDGGQGP
ncbi:MAG: tryptophan dimethylallyltransferase family protein [Myxococcales bacterium]